MATLTACDPSYVRCIKPNLLQQPNQFDSPLVQEQLRYLGMLETIRIRQMGFATRFTFEEFYDRFKVLGKGVLNKDKKAGCIQLLEALPKVAPGLDGWQKGLTKVFLKLDAVHNVNTYLTVMFSTRN
jgi:myosin heavy subunit